MCRRLRGLLNHGSFQRYYHDEVGMNARLDSLQAAILSVKLKHLEAEVKQRNLLAKNYQDGLAGLPLTSQSVPKHWRSAYAQYSVVLEDKPSREGLGNFLQQKGIPYGIYYPVPLHRQKAFASFEDKKADLLESEKLADKIISLPLHPFLTEQDQQKVIEAVRDFFSE